MVLQTVFIQSAQAGDLILALFKSRFGVTMLADKFPNQSGFFEHTLPPQGYSSLLVQPVGSMKPPSFASGIQSRERDFVYVVCVRPSAPKA